jgi:hypothetical protein
MTTIKSLKVAIAAHNKGMHVSANENWNTMNKAGTVEDRSIVRKIAFAMCGDGKAKVNLANARNWAEQLLPPGMGYIGQDCEPGSGLDNLRKELLGL